MAKEYTKSQRRALGAAMTRESEKKRKPLSKKAEKTSKEKASKMIAKLKSAPWTG